MLSTVESVRGALKYINHPEHDAEDNTINFYITNQRIDIAKKRPKDAKERMQEWKRQMSKYIAVKHII